MSEAKQHDHPPSQEAQLADYATRLAYHKEGRHAIWLHLSQLLASNRREHHVRIAAATCEPLARRHEGQIFQLANSDIVIVVKGASGAEIDQTVFRIRYLFADDPVIVSEEASGQGDFSSLFELESQYSHFLQMAERALQDSEKRRQAVAQAAPSVATTREPPKVALDPVRLSRLEEQLNSLDISPMARRQSIAAILPGEAPCAVFEELFVSISELARRLMPEIDLAGDRWLFQRLTLALDRRLLRVAPKLEGHASGSTSLNLNVATVLSPQFLAFDESLRGLTQKTMLIELQPVDVFSDIGSFMFARDFARERGYRLCLDGLNHLTFPLLVRSNLDFDFYKILWAPDLAQEVDVKRREIFRQAVVSAGVEHVVLCHCDSAQAITFGHGLGITMFQGRHVDQMLGQLPTRAGGKPAA